MGFARFLGILIRTLVKPKTCRIVKKWIDFFIVYPGISENIEKNVLAQYMTLWNLLAKAILIRDKEVHCNICLIISKALINQIK